MKKKFLNNERGFTLIEIISVLVILGILAAVALPKYIDLQDEARIKSAQAAVAEVKSRLSLGYGKVTLKNGAAPTDPKVICNELGTTILPADCAGSVPNIGDYAVTTAVSGSDVTIDVTTVQGTVITFAPVTWAMP